MTEVNNQIPITNNQIMTNISMTKLLRKGYLDIGDWVLFEIWDLVIGT